jgi:hypothetical protein
MNPPFLEACFRMSFHYLTGNDSYFYRGAAPMMVSAVELRLVALRTTKEQTQARPDGCVLFRPSLPPNGRARREFVDVTGIRNRPAAYLKVTRELGCVLVQQLRVHEDAVPWRSRPFYMSRRFNFRLDLEYINVEITHRVYVFSLHNQLSNHLLFHVQPNEKVITAVVREKQAEIIFHSSQTSTFDFSFKPSSTLRIRFGLQLQCQFHLAPVMMYLPVP